MSIVDIALIAARHDTRMADLMIEACVRAAARLGPDELRKMSRAFERRRKLGRIPV